MCCGDVLQVVVISHQTYTDRTEIDGSLNPPGMPIPLMTLSEFRLLCRICGPLSRSNEIDRILQIDNLRVRTPVGLTGTWIIAGTVLFLVLRIYQTWLGAFQYGDVDLERRSAFGVLSPFSTYEPYTPWKPHPTISISSRRSRVCVPNRFLPFLLGIRPPPPSADISDQCLAFVNDDVQTINYFLVLLFSLP